MRRSDRQLMSFLSMLRYGSMHARATYDWFFRIQKISRLTSTQTKEVGSYFEELNSFADFCKKINTSFVTTFNVLGAICK